MKHVWLRFRLPFGYFLFLLVVGLSGVSVAQEPPRCVQTRSSCSTGEVLDDGTAEQWRGWADWVTSGVRVQRFTPPYYPFPVAEVCTAWGRDGADDAITFDVVFYDDDGSGGQPGTLLETVPTTLSGVPFLYDFIFGSVDIAGSSVTEGSIFIGHRYDASVETDFFHPQDESPGTAAQTGFMSSDGGLTWYPADLGSPDFKAFFIRARSADAYNVVPGQQRYSDGNDLSDVPFHLPLTRYQQVYGGSEVGAGEISEIRFRLDRGELGEPFGPVLFQGATITLSTTSRAVDDLSSTFSANVGPDEVVVFQGDLTLSSSAGIGNPRPFDIVLSLHSTFQFAGAGNLLLDLRLPNGYTGLTFFDAVDSTDSVARVFCGDLPGCLTGDTAMVNDSVGLVTMFMFGGSPIFADGFESNDTGAWSHTAP